MVFWIRIQVLRLRMGGGRQLLLLLYLALSSLTHLSGRGPVAVSVWVLYLALSSLTHLSGPLAVTVWVLYLALSSLTHLSGPVAVTVAARGLSSIRAISPK